MTARHPDLDLDGLTFLSIITGGWLRSALGTAVTGCFCSLRVVVLVVLIVVVAGSVVLVIFEVVVVDVEVGKVALMLLLVDRCRSVVA
jgi:hypothetical protein